MKNVPAENGHGAFYIAIFSSTMQRQRACDKIALYIIVNNVTSVAFESKIKNA